MGMCTYDPQPKLASVYFQMYYNFPLWLYIQLQVFNISDIQSAYVIFFDSFSKCIFFLLQPEILLYFVLKKVISVFSSIPVYLHCKFLKYVYTALKIFFWILGMEFKQELIKLLEITWAWIHAHSS